MNLFADQTIISSWAYQDSIANSLKQIAHRSHNSELLNEITYIKKVSRANVTLHFFDPQIEAR